MQLSRDSEVTATGTTKRAEARGKERVSVARSRSLGGGQDEGAGEKGGAEIKQGGQSPDPLEIRI